MIFLLKVLRIEKKNYLLGNLINEQIPFLFPTPTFNFHSYEKFVKEQTKETLEQEIGYKLYDFWKDVLLKNLNEKELKQLYLKKE